MYPDEMKNLTKKVEETRPHRLGNDFPRMTPGERRLVLEKFHPD